MSIKQLSPAFSVSPQITQADVAQAAQKGFRAIIDTRPDGEEAGQPSAGDVSAWGAAHGMAFAHIPVKPGEFKDSDVVKMREALTRLDSPVLGYCKTGSRAAALWALTQAGTFDADAILQATAAAGYDLGKIRQRLVVPAATSFDAASQGTKVYDVVIVGGGSAGIAAASSLLKRRPSLSIAIVEPADVHYYQPSFTLVGAGVFLPEVTKRPMVSVMPDEVDWIKQAAAGFAPESDEVILGDGTSLRYRALVAAPGLKLNWTGIQGLAETLGKNGVTSNYRYDLAPYTHELAQGLAHGRALFTQPPMPIKCAGAPQKAMYLSCDLWRRAGVLPGIDVEFHTAATVLFGVPVYVPALMSYIKRYEIDLQLESKLVAVDGEAHGATFECKGANGAVERIEREFDMLHAVPPQVAPDFVAQSPLAGETGFVAVDPVTLRHTSYPNIFAMGDVAATTNAKTAAAARKQAPVVALNVLATLDGRVPAVGYDGYGSCPLTVERGKIVLAEFGYGGKLLPSFPHWLIDGTRPSRLAWFLKDRLLPPIYWHCMLKGREWLCKPHMIEKPGAASVS